MKILLTGGAGRLGVEVAKILSAAGHTVIAFDLPNVSYQSLEGTPGVQLHKGDITKPHEVSVACEDADFVIHLAAILPPRSEVNYEFTRRVNVEGTKNILSAIEKRKTPLIFVSSIATYGVTTGESGLISESHIQTPTDNYSRSKIAAETLVLESRISWTILRVAPIAVADLIEPTNPIPFREDQRVEFIYIGDAAAAIASSLEKDEARGAVMNIAGGPSWRVMGREYMRDFYSALGVEVDLAFSKEYTAVDWYDTSRSRFLYYQETTLGGLHDKLRELGDNLGLR